MPVPASASVSETTQIDTLIIANPLLQVHDEARHYDPARRSRTHELCASYARGVTSANLAIA